jgi:hypothetical protein
MRSARQRRMLTISFEDEVAVRDALHAMARADAGRSVASIIRAAVHEYLAKHHRQNRAQIASPDAAQ